MGTRIDRGTPTLMESELEAFCQEWKIEGGYVGTSTQTKSGLTKLVSRIKRLLDWTKLGVSAPRPVVETLETILVKAKSPKLLWKAAELHSRLKTGKSACACSEAELVAAIRLLYRCRRAVYISDPAGEGYVLTAPDLFDKVAQEILRQASIDSAGLGVLWRGPLDARRNRLAIDRRVRANRPRVSRRRDHFAVYRQPHLFPAAAG